MPKIVDHAKRREEIALVACQVVASRGFEQATVARIARAAGYTTGMVAHYYESKQHIILAALRLILVRIEERLTREREACFAGGHAGEQLWEGRGIIRAVYPRLIMITHEEISGLLPPRTTGFHLADPGVVARAHAGDAVRFWLLGASYDDNTLVKLQAW